MDSVYAQEIVATLKQVVVELAGIRVALVGESPAELAAKERVVPTTTTVNSAPGARARELAKRLTVEGMMGRGPVMLRIDARRDDVLVPDRFRKDASLMLRFGFGLVPPIAGLELDDYCISGTLKFGDELYTCGVPWTAVYAACVVGDPEGIVWPEDVPRDVLENASQRQKAIAYGEPAAKVRHLSAVPPWSPPAPDATPSSDEKPSEA